MWPRIREPYQPTIVMSAAAALGTGVRMDPRCRVDADSLLESAVSRKEPRDGRLAHGPEAV
jgi:hypothetical protein